MDANYVRSPAASASSEIARSHGAPGHGRHSWRSSGRLTDVPAPLSILIAFGLIAGLAIVLRWTYGSDPVEHRGQELPAEPAMDEGPVSAAGPVTRSASTTAPEQLPDGGHDALDPAPGDGHIDAAESEDEGFGLLRTVLLTADERQASLVREILRDAGIRSTVSLQGPGIAVLVFSDQLDQARRLVG